MSVPHISRPLLWFFRVIVRVWFWAHFDGVYARNLGPFRQCAGTAPLIVFGNHSSWWDPMIAVLLAAKLMPGRRHYAPMDEDALSGQRLLQQIGIFPVDIHSARGAKQFLQTGGSILVDGGVLWVTPQGRFADTREVPLGFRPGLASLASRIVGGCTLVPLATEYGFWNGRRPHALVHFGEAVQVSYGENRVALNQRLEAALAKTMDELKETALLRAPDKMTRLAMLGAQQ